jgi:transcriptional regulator with XRE-family HTH domain
MQVKAELVRRSRTERGWTQDSLAEAAGLSIRTIQRIERHGLASNESVSAICAVLELERRDLLFGPAGGSRRAGFGAVLPLLVLALLVGMASGAAGVVVALLLLGG